MENSNFDEENIGVEVPSEETNMDETRQIVPYIIVENSRNPYIDRWTRNATKEKAIDHPSEITNVKPSTLWFNNIMMHSMGLAEQATRSEKYYLFAHQRLLQLCRELDELPFESEEDCISNDQVGEKDCEMNQVGEMNSCEQSQDVTLFDPPVVKTKGHLESLRKKYALEIAQKAKKVSTQKIKKVCSQKIKKVSSQKTKKRTKNMKFNKKKTSSNSNVEAEQKSTTTSNEANAMLAGSLLVACSHLKLLDCGILIHGFVLTNDLETDMSTRVSLVSFYMNCGKPELARCLFDRIEDKNVVSWNVMVAGYFHNALPDKAVCLFRHMVSCRFQPDEISVTSALWACSTLSAVRLGKEIHCFALKTNLIED
ncbi:hypothetical protein T459_23412 [Capsicum annuum]|uniref:Pentatricopeptide repeat-containing protein n=1 Tax=Capsicum annuum TaxID=4072 RepID=A0A2G2YS88_CAPAN|nr:hypothetical protein T459_23412 [Capsicum annuum]